MMSNKTEKGRNQGQRDQFILGMPVDDLISGAEKWWGAKGKGMMRNRQFSNDMKEQSDALNAINPIHQNYIGDSNILKGKSWYFLRPDERFRVVKFYTLTLKEMDDNK